MVYGLRTLRGPSSSSFPTDGTGTGTAVGVAAAAPSHARRPSYSFLPPATAGNDGSNGCGVMLIDTIGLPLRYSLLLLPRRP